MGERPDRPQGAGPIAGLATADDVRALARRLDTDELVILPVRHHSPACAWQVREVIRTRRPSVVLVEGPRSVDALIPLLTHPEARMPLAVYTYAVRPARATRAAQPGASTGESRWSAYYPFCDYSPELVALREAAAAGIPARFIDLDFAEQVVGDEAAARQRQQEDDPAGRSLLDEHHLERSRRLHALAQQLGCRDQEDLWEHLFEVDPRGTSVREHVERVAAYCLLARRDHSAAELAADGTTAREAEMVWHVREALEQRAAGDGPVLVVVGGFHAVALPDLLADPPARPTLSTSGMTVGAALIRYSFERLERLNGYAAGMTSPGWHQQLWELIGQADGTQARVSAALATVLTVADDLRAGPRLPVPMPAVAAAFEQAVRLATLRERAAPLRSDIVDAVTSCYVKGDADVEGALVLASTRRILSGAAVGVVPPGTGTPPLVHDTLARLRAARLKVDDGTPQTTTLDIYRRPDHRVTSRLLHGLGLLGVPFATRQAGPDFVRGVGLSRLQERWTYAWSPGTEGTLAEAAVHGSTLPAAVAAVFTRRLERHRDSAARQDAPASTGLLAQACLLGLQEQAGDALDLVRESISTDPRFDAMARACTSLALLWEAREPLDTSRLAELPALLRTAYERALFLGRDLHGTQVEPVALVEALTALRELLVGSAGSALDAELYWGMLDGLRHHDHALVRGGATGLAYSAGRIDAGELAAAVTGHLTGTASATESVAFLAGILATAREAAWQEPALVASLDQRLSSWDRETFLAHLPELRLAFASLTPAETDRVAANVAGLHGAGDLGPLLHREITAESVQAYLEVTGVAASLLEKHGLGEWVSAG